MRPVPPGDWWRKRGVTRYKRILQYANYPNVFRPESICSKNFPAYRISIQNFLRFSTFAAKIFRPGKFRVQKKSGFRSSYPRPPYESYDEGSKILRIVSAFFQLLRRIFLDFSTFEPEKIDRNFSGGRRPLHRETCNRGDFFGFRGDLPVFFGRESSYSVKIPCTKC